MNLKKLFKKAFRQAAQEAYEETMQEILAGETGQPPIEAARTWRDRALAVQAENTAGQEYPLDMPLNTEVLFYNPATMPSAEAVQNFVDATKEIAAQVEAAPEDFHTLTDEDKAAGVGKFSGPYLSYRKGKDGAIHEAVLNIWYGKRRGYNRIFVYRGLDKAAATVAVQHFIEARHAGYSISDSIIYAQDEVHATATVLPVVAPPPPEEAEAEAPEGSVVALPTWVYDLSREIEDAPDTKTAQIILRRIGARKRGFAVQHTPALQEALEGLRKAALEKLQYLHAEKDAAEAPVEEEVSDEEVAQMREATFRSWVELALEQSGTQLSDNPALQLANLNQTRAVLQNMDEQADFALNRWEGIMSVEAGDQRRKLRARKRRIYEIGVVVNDREKRAQFLSQHGLYEEA